MLRRISLLLVASGCLMGYYGIQEFRLTRKATKTPEDLTLQQLIARGPEGNAHVRIRDFVLGENFVYLKDSRNDVWQVVWAPAGPRQTSPEVPRLTVPDPLRVIIKDPTARSEHDIWALAQQPYLQGMVINQIESVGSKEKEVLQRDFPRTDWESCLILEVGRKPSGGGRVFIMLIGSVILLFGGGLVLVASWRH
jgi:hypothetical protein